VAKVRADQLLVDLDLAPSRARASAMILAGSVFVQDARIDKAGTLLPADAQLTVKSTHNPYVSRGGLKLAGALQSFALAPAGLRCLDVGASTGGFTDCLLQAGAASVIAVDVGYGQLAHKLRTDPRVDVRERTNARTLTAEAIGGGVDLTVVDASFIGLEKLVDSIAQCTRFGGALLALVKPQFQVGKAEAQRMQGVVRDDAVRARVFDEVRLALEAAEFDVLGFADCVIEGPKGNREAFVHARRRASSTVSR
jgi:23S rRNA (cytidine1920-2'-O)/16S rRNA (cytidine1409-2'-O)-methyltransferase